VLLKKQSDFYFFLKRITKINIVKIKIIKVVEIIKIKIKLFGLSLIEF